MNHHLIDPPHQADGDQADGNADGSTETEPDQLSFVDSKDWAGASREEILRTKVAAAEVKDYCPAPPRSGKSSPLWRMSRPVKKWHLNGNGNCGSVLEKQRN